MSAGKRFGYKATAAVYFFIAVAVLAGAPVYLVYLKKLQARGTLEAAKNLAQAEVERARGVAEANRIIADSLKGNESYLRYLWIQTLTQGNNEIIYVPTEANLPVLEATRLEK